MPQMPDEILNDTSRWTLMASRFETSDFVRDAMKQMMSEWLATLPPDDPAKLLWAVLPQAPGWEIGLSENTE